jgi:hypothetical protein
LLFLPFRCFLFLRCLLLHLLRSPWIDDRRSSYTSFALHDLDRWCTIIAAICSYQNQSQQCQPYPTTIRAGTGRQHTDSQKLIADVESKTARRVVLGNPFLFQNNPNRPTLANLGAPFWLMFFIMTRIFTLTERMNLKMDKTQR